MRILRAFSDRVFTLSLRLPHYLFNLSYRKRLLVVILSWLPSMLVLFFRPVPVDLLCAIPVVLATLLFKYRGGLIMVVLVMAQVGVGNIIHMGWHWPQYLHTAFVLGFLVFLGETWIIGYQRNALEREMLIRKQSNLAYEQQRQLNNMKDHFLLNVSHELRTPLTEVRGYLELLQEYRERLDEETQKTFVGNAIRGCEELQLLIANMLDAMQVDMNKELLMREELCVAQIVQEVIDSFAPQKSEHIYLEIQPGLTVWSEPQHTRQILRNLLSNAFKYAPQQSPIFISASSTSEIGKDGVPMACISIKDAGPGIPPSDIPLLFNRFVRLKRDLSGPIRGSGLGLYICKQLVEGLGGKIWVESKGIEGEGSRFCFTLPASPPVPAIEDEVHLIGKSA